MRSVLVIDDEAAVRKMLGSILGEAGYRVQGAANGRDGIKLFREFRADIVVTDIIMPEKEGIETIRELRRLEPNLPIVAISGSEPIAGLDILALAEKLGATQVLSKPFTHTTLLEAVGKALASSPVFMPAHAPVAAADGS